jgi:hypothetical protein
LTGDSEKNKVDGQDKSVDSKNHNRNTDKSQESSTSTISGIISNLKKITYADEFGPEKTSEIEKKPDADYPKKPENKQQQNSSKTSNNKKTSDKHTNDDHAFHIPGMSGYDLSSMKNKDKIFKGAALIIGGLLILYGLVIISASVTKVADNVIFGEEATLAAFLMLLGVLIIVAAFAQRIWDKTFLKKLPSELDVNEKESNINPKKVEDENDNKVSIDNKDNIEEENKGNKGG